MTPGTDVTVERDVERLVETAVAEFGRLDGALGNAGGMNATAPLPGVDAGDWHADLEQNLTIVFYCLEYQIPAMISTGSASGTRPQLPLGLPGKRVRAGARPRTGRAARRRPPG